MKKIRYSGFALPTVLIVSLVMFSVLLASSSMAVASRAALNDQYYQRLAKHAAESGLDYAAYCFERNDSQITWSDSKKLRPNTSCSGDSIPGASSYLVNHEGVRSTFSVGGSEIIGNTINVTAIATVELTRTSDGSVWRTHTSNLSRKIYNIALEAATSSSGRYQVCGIIDNHTWCWGNNEVGQLGDGTTQNSTVPVKARRSAGGLLGKIDTDIAVGDGNVCTISSGDIFCWGRNQYGQLGRGTSSPSSTPNPAPTLVSQVNGIAGKTATQVVTTGESVCALVAGDVYCWGGNNRGRLGIGSWQSQSLVPVRVSGIGTADGKPVTKIATTATSAHVCAIAAGKAYCWGANELGQLGDGTTTNRNSPVAVDTSGALAGKTVVDIAVAGAWALNAYAIWSPADRQERGHTCAVTSDGGLYCWGANQYGQLGQGSAGTGANRNPVRVSNVLGSKEVTRVALSYGTTCALADGLAYCWGYNAQGQMGDGTWSNKSNPTPVVAEEGGILNKTITDISAGVNRGCVVADQTTYCWGYNSDGQIGDGTTTNRNRPTEASFLRRILPSIAY